MNHLRLLTPILLKSVTLFSCEQSEETKGDSLPPGTKYYFSLFGDSRDGNDVFSSLQERSVMAGKPLFTVHLGDMISTPKRTEQWPTFVSLVETYFAEDRFYPVIGNHEVNDSTSLDCLLATFPDIPKTGYYTKTLGEIFSKRWVVMTPSQYTPYGYIALQAIRC